MDVAPSVDAIEQLLSSLLEARLLPEDKLPDLLQMLVAFQAQDGGAASARAALLLILAPYMQEAGLCELDPETGDDICVLPIAGGNASQETFPMQSNGSMLLGDKIISVESFQPIVGSYLDVALRNIPAIGCGILSSVREDGAESDNNIYGKEEGEIEWRDGAWIEGEDGNNCFGYSYKLYYITRIRNRFPYASSKLWGFAIGYAALQYPLAAADTVTVALPVGLRCGHSCYLSSLVSGCLTELAFGDQTKGVLCLASKASNKTYDIYREGFIEHAHARGCYIGATAADDRRPKQMYESGDFDDSFPEQLRGLVNRDDLRFQTYHQVQYIDEQGTHNFYPRPSWYTADHSPVFGLGWLGGVNLVGVEGFPRWWHQFTAIRGWEFNIIYGAAYDALPTGGSCSREYAHPFDPSLTAVGDQFMSFHGLPAELPELRLIFGFSTGHFPYLCLSELFS